MGINSEVDMEANLQIGPTSEGMVRLFVEAKGIEVPLDFDPEEADEILIIEGEELLRSCFKQDFIK